MTTTRNPIPEQYRQHRLSPASLAVSMDANLPGWWQECQDRAVAQLSEELPELRQVWTVMAAGVSPRVILARTYKRFGSSARTWMITPPAARLDKAVDEMVAALTR